MRLERLNVDKFKVFLTFDDMQERGITKEDLWQDVPKVHDLFRDMMLEADDELGFKVDGPIAVEVYAMPAQGMVIIVSKGLPDEDFDIEGFEEGYIEMQVTLDESDEIFYTFKEFEDVIGLSSRLYPFGVIGGQLYFFDGQYYMKFEDMDIIDQDEEAFIALLSEFGYSSTVSIHRVKEYGKTLMENEAVYQLYHTFIKR
ncbi:adaptor protein [Alkalihalophilus pseudofirmus]|uniref:Adapter protein MecA n=1 Tax=Alkalihalophilus pseudofirmus TaxID=79885 RepID=A0AAJ2L0C6_ALKPS|nr:genetic competence negative regulator [Alkalihalophilus pseudofirmus]MDV2884294.1 genetic competence negative regulator [Alkalihalophilus pseudofirmus]OLS36133.1 adaptor protein [Alkalihalophilus pseudofirmus]WEG18314.1 genetic competence negative regulator [Alkalihalophilus pseudofirmus]